MQTTIAKLILEASVSFVVITACCHCTCANGLVTSYPLCEKGWICEGLPWQYHKNIKLRDSRVQQSTTGLPHFFRRKSVRKCHCSDTTIWSCWNHAHYCSDFSREISLCKLCSHCCFRSIQYCTVYLISITQITSTTLATIYACTLLATSSGSFITESKYSVSPLLNTLGSSTKRSY